jgi:hypothetical protein
MKTLLFVATLFVAQLAFAEMQCAPKSSVICTVSQTDYLCEEGILPRISFTVSTTFQDVKTFIHELDSCTNLPKPTSTKEYKEAHAFANELKAAGVCAFVVEQVRK